jgi:vacuolar-type H+-ATPase subunit F/Vma7
VRTVLLGDRLTCAGYRLAGVDARVVDETDTATALDSARADGDLVLVTAPLAARLREADLYEAIRTASPPVQVVPSLHEPDYAPDIRARVRRSLGVTE